MPLIIIHYEKHELFKLIDVTKLYASHHLFHQQKYRFSKNLQKNFRIKIRREKDNILNDDRNYYKTKNKINLY